MFGIQWLTPKCIAREVIHCKRNHYIYVTRHFDNGLIEFWAMQSKSPYKGEKWYEERYSLGKISGDNWIKPKNFYDLDRTMQTMAEWIYQCKIQGKKVDIETVRMYSNEGMKKTLKEKKVYTREDFVNFGKLGQVKVKEKYGLKNSVLFRWNPKKKLSPLKRLRDKGRGV